MIVDKKNSSEIPAMGHIYQTQAYKLGYALYCAWFSSFLVRIVMAIHFHKINKHYTNFQQTMSCLE